MFFDTNSIRGSNSIDGVCDFESVPPDLLCPSANSETNRFTRLNADPSSYARVSRLDGVRVRVRLRVRVRVRVRVREGKNKGKG